MRVSVDDAICTGHGRCYVLAPEVFGADDYGHCQIVVADGDVRAEFEDQARIARDNCPERAIGVAE